MATALIGALRVNLSADTAEFRRNLTDAERIAERFGRSIGSSIRRQVLSFGAAAAAVAGPAALGMLVKSSMDTISAQVDLAKRVGASVGAIQTLQGAAKLAGASQEALSKTIDVLNQKLGEAAREGAGPAYEALQRLGIAARELSAMDADERIKALSDRMAELGYNTQQQADTLRDLGVKQKEIINLFQEGSEAIERTRQELTSFGVILSDVDAGQVEEAGDALDKLGMIAQGVGNQVAVELSPHIVEFVEYLSDLAKNGNLANQIVNTLKSTFATLSEEFTRVSAQFAVFLRRLELAQEVIASFRIGQAGGPDWEAFRTAHATAANDIAKIWLEMDARLADLKGPGPLLQGLEDHLNRINPLVQSVDAYISKISQGTGGGEDETEADQKAAEKRAKELADFQEHMAQKLAVLQGSLLTEREAEIAVYEQRLMDLEDFHARGMLSDQEYVEALARSKQQLGDKLKKIDDDIEKHEKRRTERVEDAYWNLAQSAGEALQALFGENKAIALGMAAVDIAAGIAQAMRLPYPLNWIEAAARAAQGVASIAAIRSANTGGGGSSPAVRGGGGSSSAGAAQAASPAAQAAPGQAIYINGINPGQMYSGDSLRELMAAIVDAQRDGAKIVLAPA